MDFSIESAAHVSKLIEKNITVSRIAFGQPAGVVQFNYTFEHMTELDESNEKIGGDAATADFGIRSAELFDGPPEDNIGRLVVSNFAEPKTVINIVSAVADAGRAADVTAFGVEMQQVLTSTTGEPAAFVVGISGVFGGTALRCGRRLDGEPGRREREAPSRRDVRQAHGEGRRAVRARDRTVGDPPQDQLTADPRLLVRLEGGKAGVPSVRPNETVCPARQRISRAVTLTCDVGTCVEHSAQGCMPSNRGSQVQILPGRHMARLRARRPHLSGESTPVILAVTGPA